MPHKRAKRSVREHRKKEKGFDLVPTKDALSSESVPKSVARVLNATKIRSDWQEKKRKLQSENSNDRPNKRMKTAKLQPGESLQHFNKRVESDMRPLVRAATQASRTTIRSITRKEKAVDNGSGSHNNHKSEDAYSSRSVDEPKEQDVKEFKANHSSTPKRLNDIVQAPPEFTKLPRLDKKLPASAFGKAGKRADGVLSMAQKAKLEEQREEMIKRYREIKASREEN